MSHKMFWQHALAMLLKALLQISVIMQVVKEKYNGLKDYMNALKKSLNYQKKQISY